MPMRTAFVVPFVALAALAAQSGPRLFEGPPVYVPGSAPPGQTEEMELLGDVDNDGDVDVLAFRRSGGVGGSFRPLHNDGFGNLTAGASVAIPANSGTLVCTADVDGDGFLDVIATSFQVTSTHGLWVFRGLGGGSWAAPVFVPLPGNAWVLAAGNANGDAIADVFVLHAAGPSVFAASWLLGDPALTFPLGPTVSFGTQSIGRGVVLDLDGDGISDFAGLLDTPPGQAAALYRTTAAGLVPYGTLPIGSSNVMIAADIDGDADTDLLAVGQLSSSQQYRLLRNDGAAGFTTLGPQAIFGPLIHGVRAVDWDGDGDLDLLARAGGISGPGGYTVTLLENVAGAFVQRRTDNFAENTLSLGAGTADLDGNSRPDYVDPHFLVFGTGAFVLPPNTAIESPIDWDGDGDLDHVANDLRINDGRGVLTTVPNFRPVPPAGHVYGNAVATADFDGDGLNEMLVPLLFLNPFPQFVETRRLEANGDGRLVDVGTASTAQIDGGVTDDIDGDGDIDVLGGQGLWRNNGAGAFTLVPFAIAGFLPTAVGDVDGDLDLDLVGALNQQVAVLYQTAPGTFTATTLAVTGVSFVGTSARLFDLDDDGDLDIATAGNSLFLFMPVVIYVNNGGTFAPGTPLPIGGQVLAGDLDGDGRTDLCVQDMNVLFVLRRLGPGLVYAPASTYAWSGARAAADLDQDGDIDLLGASTLWNSRLSGPSAGQRRQYGTGGAGSGGRRPLLSMLGPLRSGLTTAARVVAAPGGSVGVLFASDVEANVPSALPGVTSWIGLSFPAIVGVFGGALGQPGAGAIDMPFAIPPGANGARLFLQFVLVDPVMPIGLGYSNGCELFVGL